MNRSVNNRQMVGEPAKGPIGPLLKFFSSIWLGVTLLVLIFIYSSLGSALPPLRQSRFLEMTEFEWFHWWPFDLLIAILCINLIVATIRRIPFRLVNAGVLMIHSGILILCAGSFYYFGTKLEGDVPVFRRQVVIEVPGAKHKTELVALPGTRATVEGLAGKYSFEISNIQPEWPILSGDDEGEKAYSVSVMVVTPKQERFVRQLLAGYPQYTEDIIPGKGRAVKATGNKLVDETIRLTLAYEQQEYFFLQDKAALYVRPGDSGSWVQRPLAGLPHYHEHIASYDQVWLDQRTQTPLDPLSIEAAPVDPHDPMADVDVSVTGYLRYATMEARWVDDGSQLNPVIGMKLQMPDQSDHTFELAAFDRQQSEGGGQIAFHWVDSEQRIEEIAKAAQALLHIEVPGKEISRDVPVPPSATFDEQAPFIPLEPSDYAYRIRNRVDNLRMNDGRSVSVLLVEIRSPERTFTRMVADDPQSTRDMSETMGAEGHDIVQPDSNIVMTYTPAQRAPLTLIAGPDPVGFRVLWQNRNLSPGIGETVSLGGGMSLTLTHFYSQARRDFRPYIVPLHQRDREARKSLSMIQVTLAQGSWNRSMWLPYHHYVFPDEQYRYSFFKFAPREVRLPDGRRVELIYSRQRHRLPAPVALDDFTLLTHQGGLIGRNSNVRDYISQLRFARADGDWSEPLQMSLNNPANYGSYWFFQSFWDAPSGSSSGMNYTGLGVGNRNGVYIQLAGTAIAVLGMIFAFYIKPIIMRRRRGRVYAQLERAVEQPAVEERALEPVVSQAAAASAREE